MALCHPVCLASTDLTIISFVPFASSAQWYAFTQNSPNGRLCQFCWNYWKKYGGLKASQRDPELDSKKKAAPSTPTSTPTPTPTPAAPVTPTAQPVTPTAQSPAILNDIDLTLTTNNVNDLSSRVTHKCSIVSCDKEFKLKVHLARHYAQAHGIAIRSGSPRPIMKTRNAFFLQTSGVTKLSRRLCRHIIMSKKAARQPSFAINYIAVKMECK